MKQTAPQDPNSFKEPFIPSLVCVCEGIMQEAYLSVCESAIYSKTDALLLIIDAKMHIFFNIFNFKLHAVMILLFVSVWNNSTQISVMILLLCTSGFFP